MPVNSFDLGKLHTRPVAWLRDDTDHGIAISTRVRIARNLENVPFPATATVDQRQQVLAQVRAIFAEPKMTLFEMNAITASQRQLLLERRLISSELARQGNGSAVLIEHQHSNSIMINEEDHVRIQALLPGMQLQTAWQQVDALDIRLGTNLALAYSQTWGFLTACPTNVGTGVRASIMLHLPALVLAGQIQALTRAITELGFTVRGVFGEGSENLGDLFQVSNQYTLGVTEQEILTRLEQLVRQLIGHERNARLRLLHRDRDTLYDYIGRAYGLLQYCHRLRSEEAFSALSALRLGVKLGIFSNLCMQTIDDLLVKTQPAHLQLTTSEKLTEHRRDCQRAALVRRCLNEQMQPRVVPNRRETGHN